MPFLDLTKQEKIAPAKRPVAFRGRVPNKTDINFAAVGVRRIRWWLVIPCVLLVLVLAAAFAKFLVIDRLAAVSAAQAELRYLLKLRQITETEPQEI